MKFKATLVALLLAGTGAFAANFDYATEDVKTPLYKSNPTLQSDYKLDKSPLKNGIITVPAGEIFRALTATPVSSSNLTLGQGITFIIGTDFYYQGNLIAAAGSSINGTVLDVAKAKHGGLNGKLLIRFTQIVTPYGIQIPISAVVKTDDNSGVMVGGREENNKDYVKDMALNNNGASVAKVAVTSTSANDLGKGGTLANGVGSGGGLLKSLWDKGYDIDIPANVSLELMLTQPITIDPSINNTNY